MLTELPTVPNVLAGEVIGTVGRIIICVPPGADAAAVWAVAGPVVGAANLGAAALRDLAALLIEAADAIEVA